MTDVIDGLEGGLIVSCQAPVGSPLGQPQIMAAMARAAEMAGAVGIRADGVEDIAAIRRECSLPIIGIRKVWDTRDGIYITPSLTDALEVIEAGADIVALDATLRPRRDGVTAAALIAQITSRGIPVMADVDDLASARAAVDAGAQLIATTLSGHTDATRNADSPDLDMLGAIASSIEGARVVGEGGYSQPSHVSEALARGAFAVVVGTAITDTLSLAREFANKARSSARPAP
jgi:putative N-acetylmannosamine-6-phosphate epimerase